jgi:serine/threonine protein kinase
MAETLPRSFGPYTLLRRIALGGMAELFYARGPDAARGERDVVVKRILPHYSSEEAFVRMFVDEASLTSKLKHPNIIEILDFDLVEGQYYIAMEFVDGADLTDVLARCNTAGEVAADGTRAGGTRLSVAQCVAIAVALARGLDYAHTKQHRGKALNIVHRDISPHNAMITWDGEVKLMDFGIAKAAERSSKTQAGMVKGKVAYMSPEQARGKALDGRSDLFALGVVLWELLTFARLYQRETDFEALTAIMKDPAPPPSTLNPAVDADLDRIVLTALEKDRDWRQPDAATLLSQLTAWQAAHAPDPADSALAPLMQTLYRDQLAGRRRLDPARVAADPYDRRRLGTLDALHAPAESSAPPSDLAAPGPSAPAPAARRSSGSAPGSSGLAWPLTALAVLFSGVAALSWSLL